MSAEDATPEPEPEPDARLIVGRVVSLEIAAGRIYLHPRSRPRVTHDDEEFSCEVCGAKLQPDELRKLRADIDFVEHGDPSHLIRVPGYRERSWT